MPRNISLGEVEHEITLRSGVCLSKSFVSAKSKLEVKCNVCKLVWNPTWDSIRRGSWCPNCARASRKKKRTYTRVKYDEIANERKGKILTSGESSKDVFEVECSKGHIWKTKGRNILNGRWCPLCGGSQPESIETAQIIANSKGGMCLSKRYINSGTPLEFECKQKHRWKAKLRDIKGSANKKGTWCPYCNSHRDKDFLSLIKAKVGARGDRCLSEVYISSKQKLNFECSKGHLYSTVSSVILRDGGCIKCRDIRLSEERSHSFEIVKKMVEETGLELISETYTNNRTNLTLRCNNQHVFKRSLEHIQQSSKCPRCFGYRGEETVRKYFEYIFKVEFPTVRPAWLVNENGNRLQLDGFNEKIGLAFEHQGLQHYEDHFFGSNFEKTRERDQIKRSVLETRGIELIAIPSVPYLLPEELIVPFILDNISDSKRILIKRIPAESIQVTWAENSVSSKNIKKLEEMVKIKNGRIVTGIYTTAKSRFEIECEKGHVFSNTWDKIVYRNQWCSHNYCKSAKISNALRKHSIADFRHIVEERGGTLVSTDFQPDGRLQVECPIHGVFAMFTEVLLRGGWCRKCANKKITDSLKIGLNFFQEYAIGRGGICNSTTYKNLHSYLSFTCKNGHTWESIGSSIRHKKTWCRKCRAD